MIWPTTEIGKVGQIFDGPHATPKTIDKGPIFLGISALNQGRIELSQTRHVSNEDFIKWTRRVTPKPDDIVFSYETRIGEVAIIPEGLECCLGRRMGLVRLDISKILPRFFLYNYLSPSYQKFLVSRTIPGSTVDRLSIKEFPSFPIPLPPMDEQKRIVKVLEGIDDKIELNRQMNETLEEMARSTFKSWFVDFDPVVAKAAGQAPAHMSADTAALFPASFNEEGLPDGWTLSSIKDEFHLTMGQSPSGDTYNETGNGLPFFQGRRDFGTRYPSNRIYCTSPKRLAQSQDTLISVRAPVGDLNMAMEECCIGRGVAALRHKSGSRSFTYYSACNLGSHFKTHDKEGTVFGAINKIDFEGLPVTNPGMALVGEFESLFFPIDEKIKLNNEQNQTLADLRDTLLPKLMSGEIRLRDVEKAVEDQL
ncbi:MAG: restriction endonuclease subunit S [Terasakiella sp.]|uniref:restriction endonuclease subunit S n=1 Tax=unclassified Terasakiella TaxID=2614952 RepID=UPI003B00D6DD